MKKNLLVLSLLCSVFVMNAQFTVEDLAGNPIVEGDIVAYNSLDFEHAALEFFVNNTSATEEINMRIEFVSATNADGSQMELCFGECYTGIAIGTVYPIGLDMIIAPGGQTGPGNHMYNADPGDGSSQLDYVFRFFQVDAGGNEIGTPMSMTYRYDPLLGVNDVEPLQVAIVSTIVANELVVNAQEDLDVVIYDLQGRKVLAQSISVGQQAINVSGLRSQLYLVQFSNNKGVSQTSKIVVR
ncbi:putative secreted protein (Por secretion system target) [Ulvibacter sp. MAR_2010_11]|uniref:T9SS type A sorting domain-containing protein n=1 Tax=Ulvibacter sp. MAR_2010_11 TaxID=1250229 RepID=UPI000C2C8E1B|nr:T9SS type A sorting domain-containing protein [Ulvibacter sp. MAR_2010_11]PKA82319.1 putative secreted protein (Por secretion system target) [Ulvibacter sp. MAR_2010_11]